LTAATLTAIYQHLGGRPKDLADGKKESVLAVLRLNPEFLAIVESTETGDAESMQSRDDIAASKTESGCDKENCNSGIKEDKEPKESIQQPKIAIECSLDADEVAAGPMEVGAETLHLRKVLPEQYGNIVNVPGDGNCGYHSMYHGLVRLGLVNTPMGITSFRKELHDFASASQGVLQGDLFSETPTPSKFVDQYRSPAYPKIRSKEQADLWYQSEVLSWFMERNMMTKTKRTTTRHCSSLHPTAAFSYLSLLIRHLP